MSEPTPGIHVERSQRADGGKVWHWLTGDTYPHRELLKRHGARFSSRRRAWYWIGEALPAAIQALVAIDEAQPSDPKSEPTLSPELERQILAVLAADDAREQAGRIVEPKTKAEAMEPPEKSPIRISKPAPLSADGELNAVQAAIRDTKHQPLQASVAPVASGRLAHICQAFCGEITGSITGQVFCYGYAVHDGIAAYINMAGPRMAVEAIRAKLSKGEHVTVVPPDAPSVELTAGERNTGMYHAYLHYLPEARFASLILVHDWVVTPNYGGKATTFSTEKVLTSTSPTSAS